VVIIINNRISHGFLLIEIMMALALLLVFTGVIAYYCAHINTLYHYTKVYSQAIAKTQQAVEDTATSDEYMHVSYNTIRIQLPELPLEQSCSLAMVTTSWQGYNHIKHEYSLCGAHYDK
jgi:hypothetical protein